MRICSAGACPPQGSGRGVAEPAVLIRCTKPQLRLFIPWCAGACRHTRLARKHVPDSDPGSIPAPAGDTNHRRPNNDSPGSQEKCSAGACPQLGAGCVAQTTPDPFFIPWCAGACRHTRLARKHVPDSDPGSIPAAAGDTNHRRPNNDSPGSQERNVALGLVPSHGQACRPFGQSGLPTHHSGKSMPRTPIRGRSPTCGGIP